MFAACVAVDPADDDAPPTVRVAVPVTVLAAPVTVLAVPVTVLLAIPVTVLTVPVTVLPAVLVTVLAVVVMVFTVAVAPGVLGEPEPRLDPLVVEAPGTLPPAELVPAGLFDPADLATPPPPVEERCAVCDRG